MALTLTRARIHPLLRHDLLSPLLRHHLPSSSSDGAAITHPPDPRSPSPLRRSRGEAESDGVGERRGRGGGAVPMRLPDGSPLPLHRHPHPPLPHRLHHHLRQDPPLLPPPFPLTLPPLPQAEVRFLNPRSPFSTTTAATTESDSNVEDEKEKRESFDVGEVERVCKVVEELFSSDRNMEAVLDQCDVRLSPALVVEVLERFRHAHRPAHRFFRWASGRPGFTHDAVTYNSMLAVLGKTRQFESMVALLEEIGEKGLLTMEAFKTSIKAFAAAREMKKSVGIFKLMKRYDFEAGIDTFNCLLGALAKAKLAKEAQALFDKMRDQYPPDVKTHTILLTGWCKIKNLIEAGRVWNEMIDMGSKPDIMAHNIMFEGLIKGQRRSEAIKLFELMKAKGPSPSAWTYTILIGDLCKGGKMEQAVACFQEMVAAGHTPDAATYTCLMVGFGNARRMDKVSGLLREMREKGCLPDGRTYNALIKLMTNRSMQDDAVRIYEKMIKDGLKPTLHTYNMMLKSYFHGNNYEMGCQVWEEMKVKGICPDDNSYTVFIGGHIRHGKPEEAFKYTEEMINKGMKVPHIDYNKLAADFSKAGKPDALYELAQKLNFSGKFQDSNVCNGWAERMKKRVKRQEPPIRRRLF